MFNCIARAPSEKKPEDDQGKDSGIPVLYIAVPTGNETVRCLHSLKPKCPCYTLSNKCVPLCEVHKA